MSLWHMDWKQLWNGAWWIAVMDDASRLIMSQGVFQDATAENTIQTLKQAIAKYGRPREILTDRGSQFYANESERREKDPNNSGCEIIMGNYTLQRSTQGRLVGSAQSQFCEWFGAQNS